MGELKTEFINSFGVKNYPMYEIVRKNGKTSIQKKYVGSGASWIAGEMNIPNDDFDLMMRIWNEKNKTM